MATLLKFRVYNKSKSEFIYSNIIGLSLFFNWCERNNLTESIQQSAGEKDRLGGEIFEGDIVSFKDCAEKLIGEIINYSSGCMVRIKDSCGGICLNDISSSTKKNNANYYNLTIIGNTFQNPELMK